MPTAPLESDFSRGMRIASGFVPGAVRDIQTAIDQAKMDKVANALMNSGDYAPRAEMVGWGKNPQTGEWNQPDPNVNWQGTAPRTGGVSELALRQKVQEQNIIDQLRQAQTIEALQKGTGQTGLTPYQAATLDIQRQRLDAEKAQKQAQVDAKAQADRDKAIKDFQTKNAYTYDRLEKEFNQVHATDKMTNAASLFFNAKVGDYGKRVRFDPSQVDPNNKDGTGVPWVADPNGDYYLYADPALVGSQMLAKVPPIKMTDLQDYMDKYKAIKDAGGILTPPPRAELVAQTPRSAQTPGFNQDPHNAPPEPKTKEEYDAIPPGTMFKDLDGETKPKM